MSPITPGTFTGTYGTLVLNANGTYTYTLTSPASTTPHADDGANALTEIVTSLQRRGITVLLKGLDARQLRGLFLESAKRDLLLGAKETRPTRSARWATSRSPGAP